MLKATVTIGAAALLLALPAFAGYGGGPDVTVIIRQATTRVHAKAGFSKAVLLEADGTTNGKKVTVESGISKWRFVFQNQTTPGFKFASAFLNYSKGHFGSVVAVKAPFLEDRNITSIPKLTLTRAIAKLRAAGYKSGFFNVTLRWPLNPGNPETLYIFGFGSSAKHPYVAVGTKTGKVKPIS